MKRIWCMMLAICVLFGTLPVMAQRTEEAELLSLLELSYYDKTVTLGETVPAVTLDAVTRPDMTYDELLKNADALCVQVKVEGMNDGYAVVSKNSGRWGILEDQKQNPSVTKRQEQYGEILLLAGEHAVHYVTRNGESGLLNTYLDDIETGDAAQTVACFAYESVMRLPQQAYRDYEYDKAYSYTDAYCEKANAYWEKWDSRDWMQISADEAVLELLGSDQDMRRMVAQVGLTELSGVQAKVLAPLYTAGDKYCIDDRLRVLKQQGVTTLSCDNIQTACIENEGSVVQLTSGEQTALLLMQRDNAGIWFAFGTLENAQKYLDAAKRFADRIGVQGAYFYNAIADQTDSYFFEAGAGDCMMMRENTGKFYHSAALMQNWYDTWEDLSARQQFLYYHGYGSEPDTFHVESRDPNGNAAVPAWVGWLIVGAALAVIAAVSAGIVLWRKRRRKVERMPATGQFA